MTLFSASFACIEIIKYLAGLVNMNESFKVRGELLFSTLKLTYINVKKNPDCPICGERGAIKWILNLVLRFLSLKYLIPY